MFVFFGLVATLGTTYVAVERITGLSIVMGCAAGCLSCALLVVNNLRDIPSDTTAGKRTLAVRLGDARTRAFYVVLLGAAFALVAVAAAVAAVGAARPAGRAARRRAGADRAQWCAWSGADPGARRHRSCCSWPSALLATLGLIVGS